MSIKSQLLRGLVFNFGGHLLLLIASFFSLPILVNSLGAESFGRYILVVGIPALAGLFDLGFGNGSLYYLSQAPNNRSLWSKIWGGNLLATIPMLLGATLLTYFILGKELVIYVVLLVLLNQLGDIILMLAQALSRYHIFNLKVVVVGLGNTLASAYVASTTHSLSSIIIVQVFFHFLTLTLLLIWLVANHYQLRPTFNATSIKQIARYGLTTFGSSLAGQLQVQAARYYLSFVFNSSATAIYGLAQSLAQKGLTLIQVTGRSFFATSANLVGTKRYATIRRIYLSTIISVLVIGGLTVFMTHYFGLSIITWWLGDPTLSKEVYSVLIILAYWFVSVSLTPLTSYIGLGVGEGKLVSSFSISSVVVELGLLLYLTPRLGVTGPAYAALISSYLHTPPFLYILWSKLNAKT